MSDDESEEASGSSKDPRALSRFDEEAVSDDDEQDRAQQTLQASSQLLRSSVSYVRLCSHRPIDCCCAQSFLVQVLKALRDVDSVANMAVALSPFLEPLSELAAASSATTLSVEQRAFLLQLTELAMGLVFLPTGASNQS